MAYSYTSAQLCGQQSPRSPPSIYGQSHPQPENMASIFHRLGDKLSRRSSASSNRSTSSRSATFSTRAPSPLDNIAAPAPGTTTNPFQRASPPTRRPGRAGFNAFTVPSTEPPPPYSPPTSSTLPADGSFSVPLSVLPGSTSHSSFTSTPEDPFAFLSTFDTHFLIDDSGSMAGRSWRDTAAALAAITPICTAHDVDGIDISFLNALDRPSFHNITSAASVSTIFKTIKPHGATPTGNRLHQILKPYLLAYEATPDTTKPLNIIVVTDGAASDDVESVLISAAKKLDRLEAPAWQVGVQFFQVGNEPGAAEALKELDDELGVCGHGATEIRDMVDTVPWKGPADGRPLSAEAMLKVVLGAVNRRLDRREN